MPQEWGSDNELRHEPGVNAALIKTPISNNYEYGDPFRTRPFHKPGTAPMPITTSQPRVASAPVENAPESTAPPAFQPLNAMDCSMHAVNDALRGTGAAGFETQCLVWLEGRADLPRLRTAISRLSRTCPVMTARLESHTRRRGAGWRFRPGQECPLHETTLDSPDDSAVLDAAARLLSTPRDLETEDPISFHLLHRPDGRDLFLMQYNHSLMDNAAAAHALRLLDTAAVGGPAQISAANESHDPLGGWLARMTRAERLRVAFRTARLRLQSLRGTTARFGQPRSFGEALPARILTWHLDREQTRQLQSRVVELCRFPALSMALLGCSFRALGALCPPGSDNDNLIAGIGLDLGLPTFVAGLATTVVVLLLKRGRLQFNGTAKEFAERMGALAA